MVNWISRPYTTLYIRKLVFQVCFVIWVRILKARYYPDCEFKDAVLGHRPSWIWTSILEGRDALMGRARVQIMNGADTNIWGDNWIPDNGIITPITHVPPNAPQRVSDIINLHNRTWSLDRVSSYLSWETQKQILAIPIGPSGQRDKLVWPWTSNGLYSVKSGYHRLQSAHRYLASGSSHSSHFISNRIWKAIWSVRTLPKIRMFLWRCMSNAIPTRVNLFRRKITASPMCGLCDQYDESIEHALLLCPWAQAVWFGSPMTLRIDTQSFSTLDVWLNSILDLRTESKMEKHDLLTMLSFFLWEIWKTRCKAIMEGCRIDPCKVVETASKAKVEFQKVWHGNANNETSHSPSIGEVCSWEPPPMGFVKVNIDGSWQSNGRKAGVGVVIRNSVGEFLGGMAASRVGHSALEVEAEAAVLGLELAANLGYSDVYMESDSKTLVDGIKGEMIPVAANDVAFSIHAVLLTAITLYQIAIYERGNQKVSKISIGIVAAVWLGAAVCVFLALPSHSWLWLISIFNSIQVFMTVIKYIPQAVMNFLRKSTDGFSIGNILLDFSGGVANYAQMAVQSIDQGSWVNFYGNIGKTLLSLISIFFDLLFMGQHYVLYRGKRAVITPKIISQESSEPLVKSSDDPVLENV